MRRPARTRRLSIAAIVSLLLFVTTAAAGARSFWVCDLWHCKPWQFIGLDSGRIGYFCWHGKAIDSDSPDEIDDGHYTSRMPWFEPPTLFNASKFHVEDDGSLFQSWIPLWVPLLLLLIAPIRWLIARPANGPAFPVITDAKQEHA